MSGAAGIRFHISTLVDPFNAEALKAILDNLALTSESTTFLAKAPADIYVYKDFELPSNAGYDGNIDLTGQFYALDANGELDFASPRDQPSKGHVVKIGSDWLSTGLSGNPVASLASFDSLFQASLPRMVFHELAHAVTTGGSAIVRDAFGRDGTAYAGVEALAVAAESLIYGRELNQLSRVGHLGGTKAFKYHSFDPNLPFQHVSSIGYDLIHDSENGYVGRFLGTDRDGHTIFKDYRQSGPLLNAVSVGGSGTGLVTDSGVMSQTLMDVASGSLVDSRTIGIALKAISSSLAALHYEADLLPSTAEGSQVASLLAGYSGLRLSNMSTVFGLSNERFTDAYDNPDGTQTHINYVGPVDRDKGTPELTLKASVPAILLGSSGFSDSDKTIHLEHASETLVGNDSGSNILLGGSGAGKAANLLQGGALSDVIVGGDGADEVHADQGSDVVVQSKGHDLIYGSSQAAFVLNPNVGHEIVDTTRQIGSQLELASNGADVSDLLNFSTFVGNQTRTSFIGNGRTPEVFVAGAGGGDFTLKDGDVAVGNPNIRNIYRLSTDLVNGHAPTVSILNLGPQDTILVDGKRFNGNIHKYNITSDGLGGHVVNETGTSSWGVHYPRSTLVPNLAKFDTVRDSNPVSDLQGSKLYLIANGITSPANLSAMDLIHNDPGHVVVYYSIEDYNTQTQFGLFHPANALEVYLDDSNGNLYSASQYTTNIPGPSYVNATGSSIDKERSDRRDVAFVETGGDATQGTIVFTETAPGATGGGGLFGLPGGSATGPQIKGLSVNITGFQNGVSAGGIYFSTNDVLEGGFFGTPATTSQFGPDSANWQNVYPSNTLWGGPNQFLNLSTPASSLGQPFDPASPTTNYSGGGGIVFGAVDGEGVERPTLNGDGSANALAFAGTYGRIVGDGGNDVISYADGDGSVEIDEQDPNATADNVLSLGAGIDPGDVQVQAEASGDLLLGLADGNSISILGALHSDASTKRGVQHVSFADGTKWSYEDLLAKADTPSANNQILYGDSRGQAFDPAGASHTIVGAGGGDVIRYDRGYGALEVDEIDPSSAATNELQFADGIAPADVSVNADVNSNLFLDLGGGDRVKLAGQLANGPNAQGSYGVQSIRFGDGTVWTQADLVGQLSSPELNYTLYGDGNAQTFDTRGWAGGIVGGGGGDTFQYNVGYGALIINELDTGATPTNSLQLGLGIDPDAITVRADYTGDLLLDLGNNDQITLAGALLSKPGVTRGIQSISFANGVTWSYADLLAKSLKATPDNTTLWGDYGANLFDPQGTATSIAGRGGGDTVLYAKGYGALQVDESDDAANPANSLQFGVGISASTVSVSANDIGDIILDCGDGDQVTLKNALRSAPGEHFGVQSVMFADGTNWTYADLLARLGTPVQSGSIYGDSGSNTLDTQGMARRIVDAGGGDTYTFGRGYGAVEIDESDSSNTPNNILACGSGISPADFTVDANNAGDLILSFGGGDQVTLKQALRSGAQTYGVQHLTFADGTAIDYGALVQMVSIAAAGRSTIYGDSGPNTLDTLGSAQAANGGGGSDVFIYNRGYGALRITEDDFSSVPDNELRLSDDIAPSDVSISANANGDLVLSLSPSDQITVANQFRNADAETHGVQRVTFSDGTVWAYDDLLARELSGPVAASPLVGDSEANTLDGGGVARTMIGGGGGDTFVYKSGYGAVAIDEHDTVGGSPNVLEFGPGIDPGSVQVSAMANGDLVLDCGSSDKVTIKSAMTNVQGSGTVCGVQSVSFADGTTWSYDDLVSKTASGTGPVLYGDDSPQSFSVSPGTTSIVGRGGGDIITYTLGSGVVTVDEFDQDVAPYNRLVLGEGIDPASISVEPTESDDLVLNLGNGDQITLKGQLADPQSGAVHGVQSVEFADGRVWTDQFLKALATGTYQYAPGDNPLEIDDALVPAGAAVPWVQLDSSIKPSDITTQVGVDGKTLAVLYNGTSIVTFDNIVLSRAVNEQILKFGDGTSLNLAELEALDPSPSPPVAITGTAVAETFDLHGRSMRVNGGGGGDTFAFNAGYGLLSIDEEASTSSPDNTLKLGPGITPDQTLVTGSGSDLILSFGNSDQVTLERALAGDGETKLGVQAVHFDDGTSWSFSDLLAQARQPSVDRPTLYGDQASQDFDTQGISTTIIGGGGGDSIHYGRGYGPVYVQEPASNPDALDTLVFASGIAPSDVNVTSDPSHRFELSLGGPDFVVLNSSRHRSDTSVQGVQQVRFADGTVWSYSDLLTRSEVPSSTNLSLFGDLNGQTLDTQGIADQVTGEGGGDTFVYNSGYRGFRLFEYETGGSTNTLQFGSGISPSDVTLQSSGNDLLLRIAGNFVRIDEQLTQNADGTGSGVQRVAFNDGTTWTAPDMIQMLSGNGSQSAQLFSKVLIEANMDGADQALQSKRLGSEDLTFIGESVRPRPLARIASDGTTFPVRAQRAQSLASQLVESVASFDVQSATDLGANFYRPNEEWQHYNWFARTLGEHVAIA